MLGSVDLFAQPTNYVPQSFFVLPNLDAFFSKLRYAVRYNIYNIVKNAPLKPEIEFVGWAEWFIMKPKASIQFMLSNRNLAQPAGFIQISPLEFYDLTFHAVLDLSPCWQLPIEFAL